MVVRAAAVLVITFPIAVLFHLTFHSVIFLSSFLIFCLLKKERCLLVRNSIINTLKHCNIVILFFHILLVREKRGDFLLIIVYSIHYYICILYEY